MKLVILGNLDVSGLKSGVLNVFKHKIPVNYDQWWS